MNTRTTGMKFWRRSVVTGMILLMSWQSQVKSQPSPGCCLNDGNGTCVSTPPSTCLAQGGEPIEGCSGSPTQCAGACCFIDGSCALYLRPTCNNAGGTFQGLGTTCTAGACLGACCESDGGCHSSTAGACAQGDFNGPGSICDDARCYGACCLSEGECAVLASDACALAGGTYQGRGVRCLDIQCAGACCEPNGTCRISAAHGCGASGEFNGLGSTCAETQCAGACCTVDGCVTASPTGCGADEYMGLGTSCATTDCFGACCDPSSGCFDSAQIAYCEESAGAEFLGRGTRCAATNCFGACCLTEKGCVETTSSGCLDFSGIYQGDRTVCGEDCPGRLATGFTYQGQLRQDGSPYSGGANLRFTLWDLPMEGQLIAGPVELESVGVANGLFNAVVDFGEGALNGNARWLEIAVCTENCLVPADFVTLQPRQQLTAVPYALQTRGIVVNEIGDVGVGTKTPTEKMDVAGVVKAEEFHLANDNGLPLARWDGTRITNTPDVTVSSLPSQATVLPGTPAWINPAAALVSDDVRATVQVARSGSGPDQNPSQILEITGFNFSIPADATVTFVSVYLEGSSTSSCYGCGGTRGGHATLLTPRLVSGGLVGPPGSGYLPAVEAVAGAGFYAPTDWTPAMYNSSSFGLRLQADLSLWTTCLGGPFWPHEDDVPCECYSCDGNGSVSLDSVKVEIRYHQQTVVGQQWSLGLAEADESFRIAPTANLSNPAITVLLQGNVGINVSEPFYGLQLPNTATSNLGSAQARAWFTYSSKRWKENVQAIPDALDKVLRLNGVMFDWSVAQGGERDIGFLAEDVAKVVPELVTLEADGQNAAGMKYDRVTALTVEAIKELNAKFSAQVAEIAAMRAEKEAQLAEKEFQIAELQRRLSRVELLLEESNPKVTGGE